MIILCMVAVFEAMCIETSFPGKDEIDCKFSNPVESVVCVFDNGFAELCTFPLVLYYGRFLGDSHTVDVIVNDVFGQSMNLTFNFTLIPRKSFACNEAKVTHFQYYSSTYTRLSNICCPYKLWSLYYDNSMVAVFEAMCNETSFPGKDEIDCKFSNPVESVVCVFDNGFAELCTFPLVLYYGRFLGDSHTVDVIVNDVFGQSMNLTFNFTLIPRK